MDSDLESSDDFLRELAHAPSRPPDPTRVAQFRIIERVGQGGMGVVFRAEDEKLHRIVALKLLLPRPGQEADQRERFLREARAAAALTHPNIAVVYEVGEADGIAYIAMEFVEGATLRAVLRNGPLELAAALPIALQIAQGLASAHEAHVVHRDLKPENVIVGKNGVVKIVDFGLAKRQPTKDSKQDSFQTDEGRVAGTPAYMSPEQARGKLATSASDVFAFGVILHEMLTGNRPFSGETMVDVMIAIDRGTKPPLITPELDSLMERCLAKDADKRPPSGRELVELLSTASSSSHERQPVTQHRNVLPWVLALFAAIALIIAGVSASRTPTPAPATTIAPTPAATASASGRPANDFDRQ